MTLPAAPRFLLDALSPTAGGRARAAATLRQEAIDWPAVCRLAGQHRVTPALAGGLRRHGLFDALPGEVAEYLATLQDLNRARNRLLYRELVAVAGRLNAVGIEPLLLKGANALLPDDYPGAEDRVLGDLDLLVPAGRLRDAYRALVATPYAVPDGQPNPLDLPPERLLAHHHGPSLYHAGAPVRLELHHAFLRDSAAHAALQQGLAPVTVALAEGVRVARPDLSTRLLHNVLHTQIADRHAQTFTVYLRPLLEFVQLLAQAPDDLTLVALRARLPPGQRRAFDRYVRLAGHFLGQPPLQRLTPGDRLHLAVVERTLTRPGWHRCFTRLPGIKPWVSHLPRRLRRLPGRLLTPGWLRQKLRDMRRAG